MVLPKQCHSQWSLHQICPARPNFKMFGTWSWTDCPASTIPSTSKDEGKVIVMYLEDDMTQLDEMSIWYVAYGAYKWKWITGLQNHQGPTFYPGDWAELQAPTPLGHGVLLESEKKQKWDCSASGLLVRLHISLCTVSQIQRSLSFLFSLPATSRSLDCVSSQGERLSGFRTYRRFVLCTEK